jgi:hypothetical protein
VQIWQLKPSSQEVLKSEKLAGLKGFGWLVGWLSSMLEHSNTLALIDLPSLLADFLSLL